MFARVPALYGVSIPSCFCATVPKRFKRKTVTQNGILQIIQGPLSGVWRAADRRKR